MTTLARCRLHKIERIREKELNLLEKQKSDTIKKNYLEESKQTFATSGLKNERIQAIEKRS